MELHSVTFNVEKVYVNDDHVEDDLAMVAFDDGQVVGVNYQRGAPYSSMFAQVEQWLKTGYSDNVIGHRLEPVTSAEQV